ncbi:MAG: hypothetical protein P8X74_06485, partial [Reinekea sp.]
TSVKHFQPPTQKCTCSLNYVNCVCANSCCSQSQQSSVGATNYDQALDKAIWRRFQLQLKLPQPTRAMAIEWFDGFAQRIGHPLGYASSTLADKLKGLSFAELEEFGLDVQRKYVLGLPESEQKIKQITKNCLEFWSKRMHV